MSRYTSIALAGALAIALSGCAATSPPPPAPKPVAAPPKPAAAVSKPPPSSKVTTPSEATLAQYKKWISEARTKHPYADSEARMYAVMMCESRGMASAVNPFGGYTGLFQYAPTTWSGAWNTYSSGGIKDAKSQIFATALAWKLKMQNQWGCYKKTS